MATANYDLDLTENWRFHLGDFDRKQNLSGNEYHTTSKAGGALKHLVAFDESANWQEVPLPHDWLTELPVVATQDATKGCKARDMAWYKTSFPLGNEEIESAQLIFDGILGECTVFVNGVVAARNFSGYNRFSAQVDDYLLPNADNEIVVFVDARRHEGWWYEGAGIYRPVRIRLLPEMHIVPEDCFIRTEKNTVIADLQLTGNGIVSATLLDADAAEVATTVLSVNKTAQLKLNIPQPNRWSCENPYLYTLSVTLTQGDVQVDQARFPVGFRDITWNENGMCLDGISYRIKGICAHQDHSGFGAAVCEDVEKYRIRRLQSLGANAYRCAHHAPSETLLNICDRLGMLVMVENRHFNTSEDTLRQLDALVKLSRNHPCVMLYCMFNEEPWQSEARGKRIAAKLRQRVHKLDNTRPVTGAQNAGVLLRYNASEALDVVGINYNLDAYERCHELAPKKPILGTENSPTFATRSVYASDRQRQVFADNGVEYPRNFSQPLYETMQSVACNPFVAGCFVWSGFDHRGEPNPFEYPSVSSHWGFLDSCGFDKNIAHWLRAYYLDEPFLRICTYADAPKEGIRSVRAFTNEAAGELFVDGISQGIKNTEHCTLEWEIPAEFHALKIATKNLTEIYTTPLEKAQLSVINATPKGKVRILNVCVTDKCGRPVLSENGLLRIDGNVLAVGNGDPNSHHLDKAHQIHLFNGMAQIIVGCTGNITLTYDGLAPVRLMED